MIEPTSRIPTATEGEKRRKEKVGPRADEGVKLTQRGPD